MRRRLSGDCGGAASLETQQIVEVEQVYWEHLHLRLSISFRVKDLVP